MLDRIRNLFMDRGGAPAEGAHHSQDELQLAAAALLVEAACMDDDFDSQERATVQRLLAERFGMEASEAGNLVDLAEQKVAESVELFSFVRTVKDRFDHDERVGLMEMLWEVAYADGTLHDYEANLLRRLTALIHVTDRGKRTGTQASTGETGSPGLSPSPRHPSPCRPAAGGRTPQGRRAAGRRPKVENRRGAYGAPLMRRRRAR